MSGAEEQTPGAAPVALARALVERAQAARAGVGLRSGQPGRLVLGLTGPPGAGKSTLARSLVAALPEAAYLPMDGFHLSNAQLARLGLTDRKGSPPSFDAYGFAALLARAVAAPPPGSPDAHPLYVPDYDRTLHEPVAARHVIPPEALLIVTEGNYLALDAPGWREARALIDALWYVDAPDDLRERRLNARHQAGGSSPERARDRITGNDRPNGEVVKAARDRADLVLRGW